MTLHDNKYKHKKSYKYVTNVYCMTLHDNKYKHKKSYKYVTNVYCMTLHEILQIRSPMCIVWLYTITTQEILQIRHQYVLYDFTR